MKLKELAQAVGLKLGELFPGKMMYVNKIPDDSVGCFQLNILEAGGVRGISARKRCYASLELLYFGSADEEMEFMDWADVMQDNFTDISASGQVIHTRSRSVRCEDMIFHFLFSVDAAYIEYEPGEPMEELEVGIENRV